MSIYLSDTLEFSYTICETIDLFLLFFDRFDEWGYEIPILDRLHTITISMDEIWIDFLDILCDHSDIGFATRSPYIAISTELLDLLEGSLERSDISLHTLIRCIEKSGCPSIPTCYDIAITFYTKSLYSSDKESKVISVW
jgi:hypothetical protein